MHLRQDFKPCLAVKPAVAKIVHHAAEGGHVRALGRIEPYRDNVVARAQKPRHLGAERGVAAKMFARLNAVYKQLGDVRGALENNVITL